LKVDFDFFVQLEDLYIVKNSHLKYLNIMLPEIWQTEIPGGYGDIWEREGWKFYLRDLKPMPKPLRLLTPDKRGLATWTLIGFTNELILGISPESLGHFLDLYVMNPSVKRNMWELMLGEEMEGGVGMKAFGSIVVCAREENRFIDRFLPVLRSFAENDPRYSGVDAELREAAVDFLKEIEDFRRYLDSDCFLFRKIRRDLKELFRKGISVAVLGYGETGSVLSLASGNLEDSFPISNIAYRKMPIFPDRKSIDAYEELFNRYHIVLKRIGLNPPRHGIRKIKREDGTFTVFTTQTRLPSESIGWNVVEAISPAQIRLLFRMILEEELKVAKFNRENPEVSIGLDLQISNWAVIGFEPKNAHIKGDERLAYIDTSTPLIRENGKELLDGKLFASGIPPFLRFVAKLVFPKNILDRYYDPRSSIIDLISGFLRKGKLELLPALVEEANKFFDERMQEFEIQPITEREVIKFYRKESLCWKIFGKARQLDFVLRKSIPGGIKKKRLPGKIGLFASLSA